MVTASWSEIQTEKIRSHTFDSRNNSESSLKIKVQVLILRDFGIQQLFIQNTAVKSSEITLQDKKMAKLMELYSISNAFFVFLLPGSYLVLTEKIDHS